MPNVARGPGKPAPDHFNRRGRAATKLSGERHRGSRVVNKVPELEAAGIGAQVDASAELRAGRDEISTIFSYKIGLPTASILGKIDRIFGPILSEVGKSGQIDF